MQLVNYTQPRYLTVAFAIANNQLQHVTLYPGINELTDSDWKRVKAHPVVADIIEMGHILEVSKRPGDEATLKKMSQEDAVSLVQDTMSVELLKKWLNEEKRPLVLRTISMKLADMVMPDRQEKILGKANLKGEKSGLDEEFPRADKLGSDAVAKKLAGTKTRRK